MGVKWGDLPHTMNVVECSIPEHMTIAEYRAQRVPTDDELDSMPARLQRGWLVGMLLAGHVKAQRAQSKDVLHAGGGFRS